MGKMIHFFFSLSLKSFSSCVFLNFDPFSYYYFFSPPLPPPSFFISRVLVYISLHVFFCLGVAFLSVAGNGDLTTITTTLKTCSRVGLQKLSWRL